MNKHKKCGTKFSYPTWDLAAHAALVSTTRRKTPLRVYECGLCSGFHLTKRPANPVVATVPGPFTPADLARLLGRKTTA